MPAFIVAFIVALIITFFLVRYDHLHQHLTADHDLNGVQKFHSRPVPRVGGLGLIAGLLIAGFFLYYRNLSTGSFTLLLVGCALPAFGFGLLEDLTKKISARIRLMATMASAGLGGYLLDAWLRSVQFGSLDTLMAYSPAFAILFTCFAVAGLANAFNIIDGYNGLAGMVGVIILGGIAFVAFQLHDSALLSAALVMAGAILGFLLFNYPRGHIFLGDGGAYLIGFWIAELSVLLTARHPSVPKWFPLLLCAYPIFETIFSIYRRLIVHRTHPGLPDASHLHQLIYKRVVRWGVGSKDPSNMVVRNSLTAPYLWLLTSLSVIPAILFWDNVWALRGFAFLFVISYVLLYRQIVFFKVPKWLTVNPPS